MTDKTKTKTNGERRKSEKRERWAGWWANCLSPPHSPVPSANRTTEQSVRQPAYKWHRVLPAGLRTSAAGAVFARVWPERAPMFNEEKSDSPNWQAICLTLQLVVREEMGTLSPRAPASAVTVTGVAEAAPFCHLSPTPRWTSSAFCTVESTSP